LWGCCRTVYRIGALGGISGASLACSLREAARFTDLWLVGQYGQDLSRFACRLVCLFGGALVFVAVAGKAGG
jgi:hypothetical protein